MRFRFAAIPAAVAEFDCDTSPSLPGLSTRIDDAEFEGLTWTAAAPALALWSFVAFWPAICVASEPLPDLPYPSAIRGAGAAVPPAWLWSTLCSVALPFSPAAIAVVLFDCETLPPLPGLSTRIDDAVLLGAIWAAAAYALASWVFEASWPATCVWLDPPPPAPVWDWPVD